MKSNKKGNDSKFDNFLLLGGYTMKKITVYHYDAFSTEPHKGNPAGIVLHGDDLTDNEMQEIAHKVGFNETTFLVKSDVADLKLRYFTPGHEMNLCGHGTVATIFALKSNGLLKEKESLTIETKAGILPIRVQAKEDLSITMRQASPQFFAFEGSREELAESIGLHIDDLDLALPIVYGSTGTWTLLVPIKKLDAFTRMKPINKRFPAILTEKPNTSVHPFCMETYDETANMHARHFSSPFSGTSEDPVTGTASGVMGAYYAKYINRERDKQLHLVIEQGLEIGKNGRVSVSVRKQQDSYQVEITGSAVYVDEFEVEI